MSVHFGVGPSSSNILGTAPYLFIDIGSNTTTCLFEADTEANSNSPFGNGLALEKKWFPGP